MKPNQITLQLLLSIIFLQLILSPTIAQWVWQNPLPQGNELHTVYFADANTGYAVGEYGIILKTNNGGSSWSAQTSGTNDWLISVYFTDPNTGYAVGGGGTIIKTSNGGANWSSQISGTGDHLYSVYFTDADSGYAVGNNGTMLKTSNGGSNWSIQTKRTGDHLYSVYFTDANTGYIVGYNGTILKTTNGGVSFIEEERTAFTKQNIVFQLFPNPCKQSFTINVDVPKSGIYKLSLIDVMGANVYSETMECNPGKLSKDIALKNATDGIYFLQVKNNYGDVANGKVIIMGEK